MDQVGQEARPMKDLDPGYQALLARLNNDAERGINDA